MKVVFTIEFEKDYKSLKNKDKTLALQIEKIVFTTRNANHVRDIPNIKKLKGYKEFFRIRVGKFRIGIKIINDTVYFAVFEKRDKIYKRFP